MLITSYDPSTGEAIGRAPLMNSSEVAAALEKARAAQPAWAALRYRERAHVILRAREIVLDRLDEIATLISRETGKPVLGVYDVGNLEEIKKYNAIEIDADGHISFFEEKPSEPKSTVTGIALYYYPKSTLPLIRQYLAEGNNPDQPGRLVQWLYPRTAFCVWQVRGTWYDVGSHETLAEADRIFAACLEKKES